jgi:hypothetical protein
MMQMKLQDPAASGFVAERDGQIVGSIFLNRFVPEIAVVGPLTVEPGAQGRTGRALLEAVLEEARRQQVEGVRLVQSPFHIRSLALYTKLGFEVREPLLLMQGTLPEAPGGAAAVRPAVHEDVGVCNQLALRLQGLQRELELRQAIDRGMASVAERDGQLVGYTTGIGLLGHAEAETTADLQALIAASPTIMGPGFFVPTRQAELLRWLLGAGMQGAWPATLMTMGRYQQPTGAFLPAISM